ncbi:MAG: hypothetical protein AB1610_07920 [Nitrospirota bacterium]
MGVKNMKNIKESSPFKLSGFFTSLIMQLPESSNIRKYLLKLLDFLLPYPPNLNRKGLLYFDLDNKKIITYDFKPSIFVRLFEFLFYFFNKIVPRVAICAAIPYILTLEDFKLLTEVGAMIGFIVLLFVIFAKIPPLIEILFLIPKTNSADEEEKIINNLYRILDSLKFYRDASNTVIGYDNSYIIKSKCRIELNRLFYELKKEENENFESYEKIFVKK